jgi:hypothetical protein
MLIIKIHKRITQGLQPKYENKHHQINILYNMINYIWYGHGCLVTQGPSYLLTLSAINGYTNLFVERDQMMFILCLIFGLYRISFI